MITKTRFTVAIIGMFVVAALLCAGVMRMREEARQLSAIGRLGQLSLALQNYHSRHGTLPPLCLRDDANEPLYSWRTLVLPKLDLGDVFDQIDFSQAWNSPHNRDVVANAPKWDWCYFTRDSNTDPSGLTHMMALLGSDSIWDPATGLPKGAIQQHPNAVLLISVPTSNVEVIKPRDITEEELRTRVEEGQDVFYVTANRKTYGMVCIRNGRLAFVPRR